MAKPSLMRCDTQSERPRWQIVPRLGRAVVRILRRRRKPPWRKFQTTCLRSNSAFSLKNLRS